MSTTLQGNNKTAVEGVSIVISFYGYNYISELGIFQFMSTQSLTNYFLTFHENWNTKNQGLPLKT